EPYIVPGVVWRAFDRAKSDEPSASNDVVLLLDEIDKADPDVPNDLLMLLDQRWFRVTDLPDKKIELTPSVALLVIITTNGERELPDAFLRRCVTYAIPEHGTTELLEIAKLHFPKLDRALFDTVVELFTTLGASALARKLRKPSTAELLDAIRACVEL